MFLECWGMLQVLRSVVQVINQSSPTNSLSLPQARTFSWEHCFMYSPTVLCEGIATFSLPMMQNLDCDLWVLCVVRLLAQQPLKWLSRRAPLSEPEVEDTKGSRRNPTWRPAKPRSQGDGRQGHVPWPTSSQEHHRTGPWGTPHHNDTSTTCDLPSRLMGELQEDSAPSRHWASASLQMCLYKLPLQEGQKKKASHSSYFDKRTPFPSASLQLQLLHQAPAHLLFPFLFKYLHPGMCTGVN